MEKVSLGPEQFKFKGASGYILSEVLLIVKDHNTKMAEAKAAYEKSLAMLKSGYEETIKSIETQTEKDLKNV